MRTMKRMMESIVELRGLIGTKLEKNKMLGSGSCS
jgi:hypothetical protein